MRKLSPLPTLGEAARSAGEGPLFEPPHPRPLPRWGEGNRGLSKSFFFALLFGVLPTSLHAQGLLPPKPQATEEKTRASPYLLIGEKVPDTLTVTDAGGRTRPLLSYKSALDVLVAGFFSPRCPNNQAAWRDLKKLYEAYKEWHVAFVGISANRDETLAELTEAMAKAGLPTGQAGLPYPALRDANQRAAQALHATATPEVMIIDEWGQLRYRGALQEARPALEAVIGHTEPVPDAEPDVLIGCPVTTLPSPLGGEGGGEGSP